MHRKLTGYAALLAITVSLLNACDSELQSSKEVYLDVASLPQEYNLEVDNSIPALGRVLFYDKQLSLNNSIACASCHKQALAFADNARFSRGFENRLTTRNSMPIQNLSTFSFGPDVSNFFMGNIQPLFWDGRETSLNQMVMRPIVNHVEMGITDVNKLAQKLSDVPYYKNLFNNAYGSEDVTAERISDALAWFVRSISSNHTRLDQSQGIFDVQTDTVIVIEGTPLSPLEQLGQRLFVEKYECNSCHQVQNPHGYLQSDAGVFANIGLDATYSDNGVGGATRVSSNDGKFKIPSLRNVALTAPYMHDGRFNTLEECIDHYSEGIADHPNLDDRLKDSNGNALRLNISSSEKNAIIAFLNTLTDYEMIRDPKFSNPFKVK